MTHSDREHRWRREWQRDGHRVVECEVCGYRHLHPLPGDADLESFYREHYHKEKQHIAYHAIDDAFVAKRLEDLTANLDFRGIYEKVETLFSGTVPRTMIDIGGGNNLLSRFFMDRGWEGTVFEPNADAADYLRHFDLPVVESMFGDADRSTQRSYSFINIQFVLEHVLDPLKMLCQSADMLDAGGLIRVCVPNDFSPGQLAWLSATGAEPPWISYPDHINYFDFDSLAQLLARAGLVEVSRDTSFPLEFLLLTGNDYYSDSSLQEKVAPIVSGFENAWLKSEQGYRLSTFYEMLAGMGMGRSAVLYARRNIANDKSHT